MLLCRKHGSLGLIEIRQCLENNEVGARLLTCSDHLSKELICLLKGKCTERLDQLSYGADVKRDTHTGYAGVLRSTACSRNIGRDDRGNTFPRVLKLMPVRTKCIAVYDTAARRNIIPMNLLDHIGVLHAEKLGPFARRKSARLQLCAHASIQYNNVLHLYPYSQSIRFMSLPLPCICALPFGRDSCGT
jgi:hypothetical protein